MKTIKPKLIGSAPTVVQLIDLIEKKMYWSSVQIDSEGFVSCSKGDLNRCFKVRYVKGRYRLEFTNY